MTLRVQLAQQFARIQVHHKDVALRGAHAQVFPLSVVCGKFFLLSQNRDDACLVGLYNGVGAQVLVQPKDILAGFFQHVALQLQAAVVDVVCRTVNLVQHHLACGVSVGFKQVFAAGEYQHSAIGNLLYLYHLHVARMNLQQIIYIVKTLRLLVEQKKMVVGVPHPDIAVAVFHHVAHLARGNGRLVAAAGDKGGELKTVERAQAMPRAKPQETIATLVGAIHRVAGNALIHGVVLHDKFGRLRMQCGGVDKPQQCV